MMVTNWTVREEIVMVPERDNRVVWEGRDRSGLSTARTRRQSGDIGLGLAPGGSVWKKGGEEKEEEEEEEEEKEKAGEGGDL